MITGWQLMEPARRQGAKFVSAVVRFGDHAREVALDRLEAVLGKQIYQDDFALDDPESENARFDFVVWSTDGRMWYRGIPDRNTTPPVLRCCSAIQTRVTTTMPPASCNPRGYQASDWSERTGWDETLVQA